MTITTPTPQAMGIAAETLRQGGVIAFATETVYGLGCDTFNEQAIEHVYMLKGRPANNPMIAHILNVSWVHKLTDKWDQRCDKLANNFWPGGLTVILPRRSNVPPSACGGMDTIAIRCPAHPVATQLLTAFGKPISAPSANKSGYVSPTTAFHVEEEYQGAVQVLDGGPCAIGIESTVVSMVEKPTVLRLGSISRRVIEQILGTVEYKRGVSQTDSPGTAARHYAPACEVVLVTTIEIQQVSDKQCAAIIIGAGPQQAGQVFQMSGDPHEYGTRLYAVLREADKGKPSRIIIEKPPTTSAWDAIHDRLLRCAVNG